MADSEGRDVTNQTDGPEEQPDPEAAAAEIAAAEEQLREAYERAGLGPGGRPPLTRWQQAVQNLKVSDDDREQRRTRAVDRAAKRVEFEKAMAEYKAGKADRQAAKPAGSTVRAPISQVGDRSSGVLACPKCGGAQFKAKRRGLAKGAAWAAAPITLGLTAAAMAAIPKTRVQCVTCKTEYLRG